MIELVEEKVTRQLYGVAADEFQRDVRRFPAMRNPSRPPIMMRGRFGKTKATVPPPMTVPIVTCVKSRDDARDDAQHHASKEQSREKSVSIRR